jgi:hypothetical protein
MRMTMTIYELSSASGDTAMFLAALFLSLGISLGLYAVIVRYSSSRALFQGWHTFPPFLAALLCTAVFGGLFKVMHATTIEGFHRVELLDREVRLYSLFPAHTVTLPRAELVQAERVSTLPGLGYLRLRTVQGTTYESALASEHAVRKAWEGLDTYQGCSGPPEQPDGAVEQLARER